MHETRLFIVFPAGRIEPLPHDQYLRLLRGELALLRHASQTLRIADWYLEIRDGRPVSLVNETYSRLRFDARGRVCPPHEGSAEYAWMPGETERKAIRMLVFAEP